MKAITVALRIIVLCTAVLFAGCSSGPKTTVEIDNGNGSGKAATASSANAKFYKGTSKSDDDLKVRLERDGDTISGVMVTAGGNVITEFKGSIDEQQHLKFDQYVDKKYSDTDQVVSKWEGRFVSPTKIEINDVSTSSGEPVHWVLTEDAGTRTTVEEAVNEREHPATNEERAVAEVKKLWNGYIKSCGDFYYAKSASYWVQPGDICANCDIQQFKNVMFSTAHSAPLSEADRMNGVEWNGDVTISYKLKRTYYLHDKRWAEWQDNNGRGYELKIRATKRNSSWNVLQLAEITQLRSVKDCSEIPQ